MLTKTCKDCQKVFPKTKDYFYSRVDLAHVNGYKLSARCIECQRLYNAKMQRASRSRRKSLETC